MVSVFLSKNSWRGSENGSLGMLGEERSKLLDELWRFDCGCGGDGVPGAEDKHSKAKESLDFDDAETVLVGDS
ncbi:hypothetical protein WN943_015617 [Citrus x changshan-huyou]